MTRLSIVHTESSCGWGGQELRIIVESQGMLARGHRVCIAAPRESRIFEESGRRKIPAVAVPIAAKTPGGLLAMRRVLLQQRPAVVNTHSSTDSWLAAIASHVMGVGRPLVRTRHISAPVPGNLASRWLYRRATEHVVTTGEALRLQLIRETGIAPGRVTSIPTGVDFVRFSPGDRGEARRALGLPADLFLIGIVATLRSWKGHRYLIEALAGIGDAGVALAIVGDGPGRENLLRQVRHLDLSPRVFMPGHQNDVVPWLRALDVFALPSYANEGVPQAIMQAMACGLPVVSTSVGAIGEIVERDITGLVVEPQDARSLREALLRLRQDAALRQRLSQAGYERVRSRFSLESMLNRMEAVFRSVVRGFDGPFAAAGAPG